MQCQTCEHQNPPNARYCNQCGHLLESRAVASYTPRHLQERILAHGSAIAGERKPVTVLFVDVVNSVELSSRLGADPWHHWLDRFFTTLTGAVHAFEGTVNQYTGDGIMALFGAPIALERHAEMAARASLRIADHMALLATEFEQRWGMRLQIRQGLNSGDVVVAAIGDDLRMDYTAKGQTTALAARLEGLARPGSILMSGFCARLLGPEFQLSSVKPLSVKGIEEPVACFRLTGIEEPSPGEIEHLPFIGRETETSLLQAYARQVQHGRGLAVWVCGETGSGKSRLLSEFAQWLAAQRPPGAVFTVIVEAHHRAEPWRPFRQLAAGLLSLHAEFNGDDEAPGAESPDPAAVLSELELRDWLGQGQVAAGRSEQSLADQATELLASRWAESAQLNQVFVLHNLHVLESPACQALLKRLMAQVETSPWLVVASHRSAWPNPYAGQLQSHELALSPMTATECAKLLEKMLGTHESLQPLHQALIVQAGGNPLYLQEAVRELMAGQMLEKTRRGWILRGDQSAMPLPDSIYSAISARIDALDPSRKQVLLCMAVIGLSVPHALLLDVVGMPEARLEEALADLVRHRLVRRQQQTETRWVFYREVVREVCYRSLLLEQRQDMHRDIAAALVAQHPQPNAVQLAKMAEHFEAAEQTRKAAQYFLQAAAATPWPRVRRAAHLFARCEQNATQAVESALQWQAHCGQLRCQLFLGEDPAVLKTLQQAYSGLSASAADESESWCEEAAVLWALVTTMRGEVLDIPAGKTAVSGLQAATRLLVNAQPLPALQALPAPESVSEPMRHLVRLMGAVLNLLLGRPFAALQTARDVAMGQDAAATLANELLGLVAEPGGADHSGGPDDTTLLHARADPVLQFRILMRLLLGLREPEISADVASRRCEDLQQWQQAREGQRSWPLIDAIVQGVAAGWKLHAGQAKQAKDSAAAAVSAAQKCPLLLLACQLQQLSVALRSRRAGSTSRRLREQLQELEQALEDQELRLLQPWLQDLKAQYWQLADEPERARVATQRALELRREMGISPASSTGH